MREVSETFDDSIFAESRPSVICDEHFLIFIETRYKLTIANPPQHAVSTPPRQFSL